MIRARHRTAAPNSIRTASNGSDIEQAAESWDLSVENSKVVVKNENSKYILKLFTVIVVLGIIYVLLPVDDTAVTTIPGGDPNNNNSNSKGHVLLHNDSAQLNEELMKIHEQDPYQEHHKHHSKELIHDTHNNHDNENSSNEEEYKDDETAQLLALKNSHQKSGNNSNNKQDDRFNKQKELEKERLTKIHEYNIKHHVHEKHPIDDTYNNMVRPAVNKDDKINDNIDMDKIPVFSSTLQKPNVSNSIITTPLKIPSIESMKIGSFTVSVWVYLLPKELGDKAGSRTILSTVDCDSITAANSYSDNSNQDFMKESEAGGGGGYSLYVNMNDTADGKIVLDYNCRHRNDDGDSKCNCHRLESAGIFVEDKRWTHVAWTMGAQNGVSLYVNGQVIDQVTMSTSFKSSFTQPSISVGYAAVKHNKGLHGSLASLAIWYEEELSAVQIGQIQRSGVVVSDDNYKFIQHPPNQFYNLLSMDENLEHLLQDRQFRAFNQVDEAASNNENGNNIEKETDKRREAIKNAMKHAWNGYKTFAFGKDVIKPLSRMSKDQWGGMGTTLVDALSTLWLMGLKDEFYEGRDWVRDKLDHDKVQVKVSVFETTIRSLGGLLSAYDLSKDPIFLEKADDLGSRLIRAFESPTGLPYSTTALNRNESSNQKWSKNHSNIAEVGTLQVEFRYLAKLKEKKEYAAKVEKVFELLHEQTPKNHDGLWPINVDNLTVGGPFFPRLRGGMLISFGAMGDSFYEYMLKVWIQGGKQESMYREMYDNAMNGVHEKLIFKSTPSNLTYVAEMNNGKVVHKMDHLTCFLGGLLALGAYTNPEGLESPRSKRDLETAKELTYTCYQMYLRTESGLSPEYVTFTPNHDFSTHHKNAYYILRPEVVESIFILYHLTGDEKYKDWSWDIFQAIETHCRTDTAYAAVKNVNNVPTVKNDDMESFFLAETLKYLYLIQDPDTEIDLLHKHVFNTEAHPLTVFDKLQTDSNGSSTKMS